MHQLKALLVAVILTAVLLSAAAMAAPVVKRVDLTAEKVAKDSSWTEMVKAIGLPFPDLFVSAAGNATGIVGNLPTPSVGRMYGGAWGTSGSDLKIMAGGWQLWHQAECPGVLGAAPDGVIVHAELGANGTHFLFVGTTTGADTTATQAAGLASMLNNAIANPDGTDWAVFDNAVSKSTTGVKMDLVLAKLKVHYNPETGALDKGVAPVNKTKAGDKLADKGSKKSLPKIPLWIIIACFILGLGVIYFGIIANLGAFANL